MIKDPLLLVIAGSVILGMMLGVCAVLAWWKDRLPRLVLDLIADNEKLHEQLDAERARAKMAEHRLAFWVGLRNGNVIVVDWQPPR